MQILEKFYLLFESNSDKVVKGNKEIEKSNIAVSKSFKEANEQSNQLGNSYVKMIDGVASAAASFIGFSALKTGVVDATKMNASLYTMSKITGQNINQLQYLSNAAAAAGGSVQGALGDVSTFVSNAAIRGINPGSYVDFLKNLRGDIAGENPTIKLKKIINAGVNDTGTQYLLMANDEEWNKFYSNAQRYSNITDQMGKNAHDTAAAYRDMRMAQSSFWSTVANSIGPTATSLFMRGADAAGSVAGSVTGSDAVAGTVLAGSLWSAWRTRVALRSLAGSTAPTEAAASGGVDAVWGAGAGAAAGGIGLGGALGVGSLLLAEGAGIYYHRKLSSWIDRQLHGGEDAALYARWHPKMGNMKGDMAFWMSQGLTREQAAGIVANSQAESGGNPAAVGDHGTAFGMFQWHADRAASILKGTNIDIHTAGREDQMKAAMWEMKQSGMWDRYKTIVGAGEAGAYFSQNFERPANGLYRALQRGKMALGFASNYSASSAAGGNNTSVKIDKIEITTGPNSDAQSIAKGIGNELSAIFRYVQGNHDDGVVM